MRNALMPVVLVLSSCGATPVATVNETDPALTDALSDPVMADPQLSLQRDGGAVGVPVGAMPDRAGEALPTLGQIAALRVRDEAFAGCNAAVSYSYAWMARLPAELALPAVAMVAEAAGNDGKACALRIVRYGTPQSPADVAAHYRQQARAGGYALAGEDGALHGRRARDGAAFWVTIALVGGGAQVDLIVNRGG